MHTLLTATFCLFILCFCFLPLRAQNWRALVLQKTKAAQTIEAIKTSIPATGKNTAAKGNKYAKKAEQEKFANTVKQFYPSEKTQNTIIQRYGEIRTWLDHIPTLKEYALTVQHPADLYSISAQEMNALQDIFTSFTAPQKDTAFSPYQTVQFASGAVVLSFKQPPMKDLHLAFKPQEKILKIAVGDFPISQQEFGPFPQKINEK